MELFKSVVSTLWTELSEITVPIINISFTKFLLGVLVLTVIVSGINVVLGKDE